jgi:hypothetical protein
MELESREGMNGCLALGLNHLINTRSGCYAKQPFYRISLFEHFNVGNKSSPIYLINGLFGRTVKESGGPESCTI